MNKLSDLDELISDSISIYSLKLLVIYLNER